MLAGTRESFCCRFFHTWLTTTVLEDISFAPESLLTSTGTVLDRRRATTRLTPKSMCRVLSGHASASAFSASETYWRLMSMQRQQKSHLRYSGPLQSKRQHLWRLVRYFI
jgi:hypothetical protein